MDGMRAGTGQGGTGVVGASVGRDGTSVLRDVTLQAAEGELLVVLGSSGSGKTTLLRAIAGLDRLDTGRVTIRGRDVTDVPTAARRVAMVFETTALIPYLDVARNIGWGLRLQRLPEDQVEDRVERRARQFRLSRLLSRRPRELSAGERGLVGVGHALVQVPEVFLLDEPLAGLDAAHRGAMRRQIVEVVRSLGVPAILVTHDQAEGLAVADRVALLDQGEVVQVGRPMDLYERPVDLRVAGSVGSPGIGLLRARVVSADGQAGFVVGDRTLPLWRALPPPLAGSVGREVVLGFRAEDVHEASAGCDPDAVALDAVVRDAEYTGSRIEVCMAVGGETLRAFLPPRAAVRPGAAIRVAVTAATAHVFDAATGQALWHPCDAADGSSMTDAAGIPPAD
jgi:multiple sugar transport system ATP-binding protein